MKEQMQIGEALVGMGAISEEQLSMVLAIQKESKGVPLGLLLADQFGISEGIVDQVNVQSVLLPRFRKSLMAWLLSFSRKDKFAKGLDMVAFVTSISTVAESFEVGVCTGRRYVLDGDNYVRKADDLGFVTLMDVRVTVTTKSGAKVSGNLHAQHDSRDNNLVITDDESLIKDTIYYGVRTAFRSSR